jgi:hypothetical protein
MRMPMLSEDDLNLRDLSEEELALAWDLWFDLAQTTNDSDPPYTHGVFQLVRAGGLRRDAYPSGDPRGSGAGGGGS